MKKIISVLVLVIAIMISLSTVVMADDITSSMKGFEQSADSGFLNNIGSNLYGIILLVGSAVAIGMLAIMAIKFMTSGAEEKAQVKKNLIGFSIGCLILLCVIGLLGIFKSFGDQITALGLL